MIPDKFNMVDMGGIDLIMMQGEAVPGLYEKLMAAISNCRYQCLYNWMFDGVLIPPTYVQIEVDDGEVFLNEGVSVTSDDVIHIYSVEPGPVDPEIIPLLAEENGVYNVPAGKDGFNPVTVDVPSYTPVIEPISITENGIYNPPSGVDGYAPVTVDVSGGGSEDGIIYSAGTLEKQSLFISQSVGNASISFNQDHLYINTVNSAYGGMIFVPIKAFDHSQFSYVKMEYSLDSLETNPSYPSFLGIRTNIDQSIGAGGIITPLSTGFPDQNNVQKRLNFSASATKTVITLDVSDVTNDFVVEVSGFTLRGFRIYKLWLE